MWTEVADALWFILPAYVANSAAVDVAGIPALKKYAAPVDGGRTFRGRRILGDGKTWRGLFGGVFFGTVAGYFQSQITPSLTFALPAMTVSLAFLLAFGAMAGDMAESFIKRQCGLARGASAPLLDQLDYIVGAFAFASLLTPFLLRRFAIAAVITVPLHISANFVAYKLKLKDVWW